MSQVNTRLVYNKDIILIYINIYVIYLIITSIEVVEVVEVIISNFEVIFTSLHQLMAQVNTRLVLTWDIYIYISK